MSVKSTVVSTVSGTTGGRFPATKASISSTISGERKTPE